MNLSAAANADTADLVLFAMLLLVGALIAVLTVFSTVVSIILAIRYVKYNRMQNSMNMTGEDAARRLLDQNGLSDIKVKTTGSLLFGNSYSHFFKKIRLRRLTRHKESLTAMAMAAQKVGLAVMDKEGDPDMKTRNRLIPVLTFGPFAFIPLVLLGMVLDIFLFSGSGVCSFVFAALAILFYALSFIFSLITLKTEKKAQERCYLLLSENGMATTEELTLMHGLFRLYNIQYINNIILSMLELIYRTLKIVFELRTNRSLRKN